MVGAPVPGEGAGWREAPRPPGEGGRLCEGLAKALSPGMGRLALRGRVAHRVLIGTKSLQRRRTRVLLLFSYLQEPEVEVMGSDRSSVCPPSHVDLDKAVSHCGDTPGFPSVRKPQGTRSENPLQPWS